jgi:3-oxoacyl-[acyl-carrier-protein] synthase II
MICTPVITGLGALGVFGGSTDALWQALLAARPLPDTSNRLPGGGPCAHVGPWFRLDEFKRTAKGHRAPLITQFALAAAAQAITQSGITGRGIDKDAVALVYGTGNGPNVVVENNLEAIVQGGLGAVEPLSFQESVFNAPASLISIEYGLRGPLLALPMGWAAAGYALAQAADLIAFGHAQAVIVVVSDEMSQIGNTAMRGLRLISDAMTPDQVCSPYALHRSGASNGEGAAALVLESPAHAAARGQAVLAQLSGWATTTDTYGTGPKRDGQALVRAMAQAQSQAQSQAGGAAPDLIFGGGYGTVDADLAEAKAIAEQFGPPDTAPRLTNLRGTIGEAKSATGLFNVIAAIRAMREGFVPATAGCHAPDPACLSQIRLVQDGIALASLQRTMCNAFWVNGTNSSVVVDIATLNQE